MGILWEEIFSNIIFFLIHTKENFFMFLPEKWHKIIRDAWALNIYRVGKQSKESLKTKVKIYLLETVKGKDGKFSVYTGSIERIAMKW